MGVWCVPWLGKEGGGCLVCALVRKGGGWVFGVCLG